MGLKRRTTTGNTVIVEVLRIIIVLFGGAFGFQVVALATADDPEPVLGSLSASMLGLIVGAGLGYSLGGILARLLVRAIDESDSALDNVTPEELVAGVVGALAGALLATVVGWPIFLLVDPVIAATIFLLWVVVAAAFGYRVARHRGTAVLGAVGSKTSIGNAAIPPAARLIDSSVAIDGRIVDVVKAGFALGRIVVCQPVLEELQTLADAADERRRNKGVRGLQTLEELKRQPGIDLLVVEDHAPDLDDVDAKLVMIAQEQDLTLLTNDAPLARIAHISGVPVQNLNRLAVALRPPVTAGDTLDVGLIREGKEHGQAVGYLDDGTMVVADNCVDYIGQTVRVSVASVLTTSNGRMLFVRKEEAS